MGRDAARIGLAGELRVMSELLLRGHNPAKSYLDYGVDMILENGVRIQVKTASKAYQSKTHNGGYYFCTQRMESKEAAKLDELVDFLICTVPRDDAFFIIPTKIWNRKSNLYIPITLRGKWAKYKDNWEE